MQIPREDTDTEPGPDIFDVLALEELTLSAIHSRLDISASPKDQKPSLCEKRSSKILSLLRSNLDGDAVKDKETAALSRENTSESIARRSRFNLGLFSRPTSPSSRGSDIEDSSRDSISRDSPVLGTSTAKRTTNLDSPSASRKNSADSKKGESPSISRYTELKESPSTSRKGSADPSTRKRYNKNLYSNPFSSWFRSNRNVAELVNNPFLHLATVGMQEKEMLEEGMEESGLNGLAVLEELESGSGEESGDDDEMDRRQEGKERVEDGEEGHYGKEGHHAKESKNKEYCGGTLEQQVRLTFELPEDEELIDGTQILMQNSRAGLLNLYCSRDMCMSRNGIYVSTLHFLPLQTLFPNPDF